MRKYLVLLLFPFLYGQDSTKVMYLGDSNTEYDAGGIESWRSHMDSMLVASSHIYRSVGDSTTYHGSTRYTFPQAQWTHNGIHSATMGYAGTVCRWNTRIRTALTNNPPSILCLMLGTNDAYSGVRTAQQIADTLNSLLDTIWAVNSSIKVLVSEILPTYDTNTVERAVIVAANAILPTTVSTRVAQGKFIVRVPSYNALNGNSTWFQSDGVHLSVGGQTKYAETLYPYLVSALDTVITPTKYLLWKIN